MLYLGLIPGEYIGWGVCSKYLIREVQRLTDAAVIHPKDVSKYPGHRIEGKVFHTIGDHHLARIMDITGTENFGYTFFENLLGGRAVENARFFDTIFAGSTWCRDRLVERGISWSEVLIQGVDPALFHPITEEKPGAKDRFVVFSGGKFELRKGQDIVIRAVKVLQDRHADVLFVSGWHNAWAFSMNTMVHSPHIRFSPQKQWSPAFLENLLETHGIDLSRTVILPRIPQDQMRKVYACTDVGLFPNRCEGGTNLVMMEYMACAKPVIASFTSGHRDILTEANSLRLERMNPFELLNDAGDREALWSEPDLDEVVEALEYAYQQPMEMKQRAKQAGDDMKNRTWADMAQDLLKKLRIAPKEPSPLTA